MNDLELFENLSTGDEIHFTDGTIWSCTSMGWSGSEELVAFVPMSFKQIQDGEWCKDYFFPGDLKCVVFDAVKGGAKIIKGVGLKNELA